MPDWNRIHTFNSICPYISHEHRMADVDEIKNIMRLNKKHLIGENSQCFICNSGINNSLRLGWKCVDYIVIRPLSPLVIETLTEIFNNSTLYFLPELLHKKIFDYASIDYDATIDNFNKETIEHLYKCKKCVKKTINWISLNACTKHSICRPKKFVPYQRFA